MKEPDGQRPSNDSPQPMPYMKMAFSVVIIISNIFSWGQQKYFETKERFLLINLLSLESHNQVEYYNEKYFGTKNNENLKIKNLRISVFLIMKM